MFTDWYPIPSFVQEMKSHVSALCVQMCVCVPRCQAHGY